MNPKAQSELHPGAELLSAFAEHALPEPERARILAHMAACARCREVVYLAQSAADEELAPAAAVQSPAQPRWFAGTFARWRVSLVPAAALAAVGIVVLWVQMHPSRSLTETAQVAPPPQPPSAAATASVAPAPAPTASPAPPATPSHSAAPPPVPSIARRSKARSNTINGALPGLAGARGLTLNPSAPAVSLPMESQRFHGGIHLDAHSAAMARLAPQQTVRPFNWVSRSAQGGPEWQNNQQVVQAAPEWNDKATGLASQAPQSGNLFAVHGPLAPPLEPAQVLQSSQRLDRAATTTNGFALMQLTRRARLPSGLHAVSSATMLNRLLVVDSAGALFLSQDAGKHWETVAAQWSGKVIEVQAPPERLFMRAVVTPGAESPAAEPPVADAPEETGASPQPPASAPAPNSVPALASAAIAAPPAQPPPPMLFTLVTDRHQTWVSADGKVWREPRNTPARTP